MRNINLLPSQYRPEPKFVLKRFAVVLVITLLLISIATGFFVIQVNIASTNKAISNRLANIKLMENNISLIQDEKVNLQKIKDMVTIIEKIEDNSISHIVVLDSLRKHTPSGITLNNLTINQNEVVIYATAIDLSSISLYLKSLQSWEDFGNIFMSHINSVDGYYVFQVQGVLRRGE